MRYVGPVHKPKPRHPPFNCKCIVAEHSQCLGGCWHFGGKEVCKNCSNTGYQKQFKALGSDR